MGNTTEATALTKAQKSMISIGCLCLMLFISMIGAGIATIMGPILTTMDAMQWFSLLTVFSTLGLVIMNPIGGKLGDLFGRRNIILISGIVAVVCSIGLGVVRSFAIFAFLRLLLGAAQGAFTAAPYIIAREINEPKDVPKAMGMLASSVAIGGFVGAIIAGALADMGYMGAAIMFPVIPLILGIVLIAMNLPNTKRSEVKIDIPGMICLIIILSAVTLSLNFGGRIGWTNPVILAGFAVTIVFCVILFKVEGKTTDAVIPVYLLKNRKFVLLLFIGFCCMFYQTAMSSYSPLAVQSVMGASATVAGTLQMPRTIITMFLPTLAGVWVGKKTKRNWQSMALGSGLVAVAFLPLVFANASTPVILMLGCIGLTGVAESFRSVSITPVAQTELDRKDLGVGTALITFTNTFSSLVAAGVSGVIFDAQGGNIQAGYNQVCLLAVVIAVVGLVLTILFVRPGYKDK